MNQLIVLVNDIDSLKAWFEELLEGLSDKRTGGVRFNLDAEVIEGASKVTVTKWEHGSEAKYVFSESFFNHADVRLILDTAKTLYDLFEDEAYIQKGEKKIEVESFGDVMDWLDKESKRGMGIQRYKGLGEMNPDQLWDTTMNPETRRMMQVKIEDAVAADDIFTTLMGDQVEPRRAFIEDNALSASNIDV